MRGPIFAAALALLGTIALIAGAARVQQVDRDARNRIVAETAANCYRIHLIPTALIPSTEEQVKTTRAFLRDNPHGIPGISATLIRAGLARDLKTLEGLNAADCPPKGARP